MKAFNVLQIVGARPQFVKAAMVSRALVNQERIIENIIHTGQHYDWEMSGLIIEELGMKTPAQNLNIGSGSHGQQIGRMLESLEALFIQSKPDLVIVHGDTNSTLAGALAAAKLCIPVAHVEAGMRSFNRAMPEEVNRVIVDHISELLFTPTKNSSDNLVREGISSEHITVCGDVMYDATLALSTVAKSKSSIISSLRLEAGTHILATVHRVANTDNVGRLRVIIGALVRLADERAVVFPVHPRTKTILEQQKMLPEQLPKNFHMIAPVGYFDMLELERNAAVIATDSGGVQKEAFFFRIPCVTLRDETEWVELVACGWNQLAKVVDSQELSNQIRSRIGAQPALTSSPYGEGDAAQKIAQEIGRFLNMNAQ